MEIKISDIKIGTRFRNDFGNIATLAQSISETGLLQRPVLNENYELIAGHRRILAFKYLGLTHIPVNIINLNDIVMGEFHENALRKGFTTREKIAIKKAIEPIIKAQVKEKENKRKRGDDSADSADSKGKETRQKIAEYLQESHDTLMKEEFIVNWAEEMPEKFGDLPEKVDEKKMSVHEAYKHIQKDIKRQEIITAEPVIVLPEDCDLRFGDFMEKSKDIPPNSIDLLFSDPPYDRPSITSYKTLAELAARVLKPGASLVIYIGQYALPEIVNMVGTISELKWWWYFFVKHTGGHEFLPYRNVIVEGKLLFWYVKGEKPTILDAVSDYVLSEKQKDRIDWQQSTREADHIIKKLTQEGQIVFDPFMGSGTTGLAALKLKRKFIGIDNNPDNYQIAKQSISKELEQNRESEY